MFSFVHEDCEHSVVQLSRPVKLRRTPFRSRQSLRASIIYKGPAPLASQQSVEMEKSKSVATKSENGAAECDAAPNGVLASNRNDRTQGNTHRI